MEQRHGLLKVKNNRYNDPLINTEENQYDDIEKFENSKNISKTKVSNDTSRRASFIV